MGKDINVKEAMELASCVLCGSHNWRIRYYRDKNRLVMQCANEECDNEIIFPAYPDDPVDLGLLENGLQVVNKD